jgi:serine/threonine protein kinase/tetratricopeptide (TPR) repeat protein
MRVGDTIDDRFVLEKQVGAGGMGVVFRAMDTSSGSLVALKAVLGADHEFERFAREAAALSRIEDPRVVRYVAHGGEGDGCYLAMEWLEGQDLAQRLEKGPLDLDDTLQVVRGIAQALEAVHAVDIVHRDIKPSNVFLVDGELGRVKLLDLGIARTQDVAWTLTATGALIGTPAYMAPEQARGEFVDARADLFALGCIFYECLVGKSPFAAAHPVASLARILVEDAPRLRDSGISVPASIETIVESLLAKDRDARLGNAHRLLDALDRLDNTKTLPPSKRSSLTLGEQQIVSVVLTRPASGTDKTLHDTPRQTIMEQVQHMAALHDARIEQLPNGSYLAVFAAMTSPRDHAARAAFFAIGLAQLLGDDAIALTTGRGEISMHLPVGAAIDRAVVLLRPNRVGIQLDAVSASLLEGRFDIATDTDGDTYQLLGARNVGDSRRSVAGQTSPFVGREREVSAITSALTTSIEEPLASIVLLTAPAGTGKSRIVDEFVQTIKKRNDITLLFVGACDMMNAGARYGVVGRAIRSDASGGSNSREERRQWLVQRIRNSQSTGDIVRIAELVAESCGLVDSDDVSSALRTLRDNPLLLSDAIADAWCSWLEAESMRGAVVFVIEDLHWGDLPTLKLIERVLRVLADRPIFVLATARPEVHEVFPGLWTDRGVQEIRLGRIAMRSAERLAKRLLGSNAADEIVKQIVERSGGHPFLLEELVRAALTNPTKLDEIPETVLGMLQARFFTQTERSRAALRAASIFGGTFWLQGTEHLLGNTSLAKEFEDLVRGEFIERSRTSKFPNHVEYSFRHALVRDAAYAMLTDTDRVTGHLLAGSWLESAGERESFVLAEHFDRGGAAGRAAFWYHHAAEDAREGGDLSRATHLAKRAIECGRSGEDLALTELLLADVAFGQGDMLGASEYAISGKTRLKRGSDPWYSATSLLIGSLGQRGLNEQVLCELEAAVAACTTPPTDAQLICIARGIGQYVWVSRERMEGFYRQLVDLAETTTPGPLARGWLARVKSEMLPHRWYMAAEIAKHCGHASREFELAGAVRDATMTRLFQVMQLAYTDQTREALEIVQKARVDIEKRGLTYLGHFARLAHGIALFFDGQDQACLVLLEPHLPIFRHSVRLFCSGHTLVALIALDARDLQKAYESSMALVGLEHVSESGKFSACGLHAYVLTALGRLDEAVEWGERAFEYSTPGFMDAFGEIAYLGLAEAYLARGEQKRVRAVIEEFWNMFLALPLDHETYPRRRIFRQLAALAASFDLPHAKGRGTAQ